MSKYQNKKCKQSGVIDKSIWSSGGMTVTGEKPKY
jgi:hypothetical protein